MVSKLKQESALQLRAAEHQAERLRIEIISLRERLDEETASQSSLKGVLEREREERGGQGKVKNDCNPDCTDRNESLELASANF